jgi:hypothetical protein
MIVHRSDDKATTASLSSNGFNKNCIIISTRVLLVLSLLGYNATILGIRTNNRKLE